MRNEDKNEKISTDDIFLHVKKERKSTAQYCPQVKILLFNFMYWLESTVARQQNAKKVTKRSELS